MQKRELILRQMEIGPMENFIYFIGDGVTKEVVIVDPAWDVDAIICVAEREDLKITGALVTHTHFDHVNGVEGLLDRFDIPVYVHRAEAEFLREVAGHLKKVESGAKLTIGSIEMEFIHTPGHTPGSQCFYVESHHLVSGDTLFIRGCGRCDLPGGDPEEMYHSLTQKLMKLPDETILYPGHNYAEKQTSTMGDEKRENPFLQSTSLHHFLRYRMGK